MDNGHSGSKKSDPVQFYFFVQGWCYRSFRDISEVTSLSRDVVDVKQSLGASVSGQLSTDKSHNMALIHYQVTGSFINY